MTDKSNYRLHAERELRAIGYDLDDQEDGPNKWIAENLFELLDVFGRQGHSGSSAPYCIGLFAKLAGFEPLGPLTGTDDEWVRHGDEHDCGCYQNKRCAHVFKDTKDGPAYDSQGRIFRDPDGCCYQNSDSRVFVTFPYTPTTEYVDREAGACGDAAGQEGGEDRAEKGPTMNGKRVQFVLDPKWKCVTRGKVRESDLVMDEATMRWVFVNSQHIGQPVSIFYAIIRKECKS